MLNTLNATPTNRLDPAVKDYFLNRTISEFVKSAIRKANSPDEDRRVPFRILTHGDILNKYNDIYTLIKEDDTLLPISHDNYSFLYNYPSDLYRFETSYSVVCPLDCVNKRAATSPSLVTGGAGNVSVGLHHYFIVFVYPDGVSEVNALSVASITIPTIASSVNLTNIPLGSAGCTARRIYRTAVGEAWYNAKLAGTISDNVTTTYTDNMPDESLGAIGFDNHNDIQIVNPLVGVYDVSAFNNHPYGGKKKYIAISLQEGGIKAYHLNRYSFSKFGIIYIKKPAVLTAYPTPVDCDLPESVHDNIVEETAKFIAGAIANNNYEYLVNEVKNKAR